MEEKLIQEYVEYFRAVLKDADKKDPATLEGIARLAEGYQKLRNC